MQKLIFFSILTLLCASPLYGQKKQNAEAAIQSVIENESRYFWGRDLKNWRKQWVHADYVIWRSATRDGVTQYLGWDQWNKQVEKFFLESPTPEPYDGHVTKQNYVFRIYSNGAWVSFEQVNNGVITYETRVLEKINGEWRIALVELIFNANERQSEDTGG